MDIGGAAWSRRGWPSGQRTTCEAEVLGKKAKSWLIYRDRADITRQVFCESAQAKIVNKLETRECRMHIQGKAAATHRNFILATNL